MRSHLFARCAAALLLLSTAAIQASSVLQVGLPMLAGESETVVVAEVVASQVEVGGPNRPLHTRLSLRVERVLAGAAAAQIELSFLGGEHNGRRTEVAGFRIPQIGERAVYFIENSRLPMVVPLLGWDQGRFLLRKDSSGVERVFSADGLPVVALDPTQPGRGLSAGLAAGVVTGAPREAERAVDLNQFAQQVQQWRELARASR